MANLADDIERFLKQMIADSHTVEIQRATLAAHFGCAPSQINYVLATRFPRERGYIVESRRGGGGYIRITRLNLRSSGLYELVRQIGPSISEAEALSYIRQLEEQNILREREAALMAAVVDRETIGLDLPVRDLIRANLLKAMILAISRFERGV